MDATRWQTVQDLFHRALDRPPAERRAFLESACDDPALVAEVEALIEADGGTDSPLDLDVGEVAGGVLGAPDAAPRQIGPYRLGPVLGEGGMGVVYLAEHEELGRRVAVKVLRDAALSPSRRDRFLREERILAGLRHPDIARLYDAGVLTDGTPYFVMEVVEGEPITDYAARRQLSVPDRLRLFRAVCEAVGYAHRQAIVHRDLKPSNVLVEESDRGRPRVKLLDFGIATSLDVDPDRTATAALMTPAYAAPEQLRGEPVGVYTDVYALGVLLYELLAEQRPYDLTGRSPGEAEAQILAEAPDPPSTRAPAGRRLGKRDWADLDVVCLTAMQKDPARRYASAEALVRDLDHFLAGEPIEARPDSARYRAGKFVRRNRAPVAVAAAALTAVVALVAFDTVRLAAARDAALAEADKAEQVSEYLVGLFEASDPFAPDGGEQDVRALLARGVEEAEQLAGQPALQAQMFDVLGRVHTRLSEYGRADTLLRRALTLRQSEGDSLGIAETLTNLGVLHSDAGEYDRAVTTLKEALGIRARLLPALHPDLATTYNELGTALNRSGDYDQAGAMYRTALRIQRQIYDEPHADLGTTLNDLATNLFDVGDYEEAERYYRESLANDRAVYGPEHPSVASGLANLGVLLDTAGDFPAADSALTEALRIKRLRLGDDHYETAFTLTQLGGMLVRKGDLDRAEATFREALAIEDRVLPDGHRNRGFTLHQLASTLQKRGDFSGAEPLFRRAVATFSSSLGIDHPYTAMSTCQLADVLFRRGDPGRADPLFRDCLGTLRDALPAGHDMVAINQGQYGEMLVAESRFEEAESVLQSSYDALRAQPAINPGYLRKARERLVSLYDAWGRNDRAASFRAELVAEVEPE
ncbi:tetratricopeptide repeat protein [Rubrivirga sp.]|uniref:serine/threonine-protein kinase n=1 Tax=Rubrivirga sp. TaxID=1885344 RepID=UPI003B52A83F